jgi:hypothetical protein
MKQFRTKNLAVLHIPKTGGRSLMRLFRYNYSSKRLMLYYPPHHTEVAPMKGTGNLFVGHYSVGKEREVFDEYELVAFLRDPTERLISNIFFMQRHYRQPHIPADNVYKQWFLQNRNVFDVLRFARLWYLDNPMVRMVSGVHNSIPFGELDNSVLEDAKHYLQKFAFVGFQETFEEDVLRLCIRYGFKPVIGRRNRGFNRYVPGPKDRIRLDKFNLLDNELYRFARATVTRRQIDAGRARLMKKAGRARNGVISCLLQAVGEKRRHLLVK